MCTPAQGPFFECVLVLVLLLVLVLVLGSRTGKRIYSASHHRASEPATHSIDHA